MLNRLYLGVDFVCASGESVESNVNLSLTIGSYSEVQSRLDGGELNINLNDKCFVPDKVHNIKVNNDNVVIKGSVGSKLVFDAKNDNMSIFTINGDNVRLENIVFKNCDSIRWGGAVRINGNGCTVINCDFIGNRGHFGGLGVAENTLIF